MLQNQKLFQHQHDTTSGKCHTWPSVMSCSRNTGAEKCVFNYLHGMCAECIWNMKEFSFRLGYHSQEISDSRYVKSDESFIFFNLFYIYLHIYTLFGPPPASRQNLFHPLVLQFYWRENISDNKKGIAFLLVWAQDSCTEIPSVVSMHLCVATHTGSSLPDLFTTSWSPSHSGLCQVKITIFALLQWAHQPHSSFRFLSLSLFLPCVFSA
jgi:hypothetical protein